jgi:ABC-type branched-subunit amino acid transport system substrate-binding protein
MTSAPAPTIGPAFQQRFGRCATRYAQLGYDAMKSLLAAIAKAGERANDRRVLTETWLASAKTSDAAFELVSDAGCG